MPTHISTPLEVEVDWDTPFSQSLWDRALSAGDVRGTRLRFIDIGPGLPTEPENRICQLVAEHTPDETLIGWHLHMRPLPKRPPPQSIRDADAKASGFDGVAELARIAWEQ